MNEQNRFSIPRAPKRDALDRRRTETGRWDMFLPLEWRDMVIAPLDLITHRDYEADAKRTLGHDEDGALCFCAHRYVVREACLNDEDEFFLEPVYAESLHAWKLRDDRWLIHRKVTVGDELENARGFYAFSESPPR